MSDTESNPVSILEASKAHIDAAGDDSSISSAVRELCNQLRANDPHGFDNIDEISRHINYIIGCSEAEFIAIFHALGENTSVKHIDFSRLFAGHNCTERSALAAAKYVESSETLQTLELGYMREVPKCEMISVLLRALSRNTSVTKLIIASNVIRFASTAFQELLTYTQTLTKLQIVGLNTAAFDEVPLAAITAA
jgi:hypothetical protein